MNTMMIATKPQTDTATAPIQWAVTSSLARMSVLISDIEESCIFDDLKAALSKAREESRDVTLMVWGMHRDRRPIVAIAHDGQLFFADEDLYHHGTMPVPQVETAPTNPLRSAFPWAVNPQQDFSVEPGLSKRELMTALMAHGLLASDWDIQSIPDMALGLAERVLQKLGPDGSQV